MPGRIRKDNPYHAKYEEEVDRMAKLEGRPCHEVFGCWTDGHGLCHGDCGNALKRYRQKGEMENGQA